MEASEWRPVAEAVVEAAAVMEAVAGVAVEAAVEGVCEGGGLALSGKRSV